MGAEAGGFLATPPGWDGNPGLGLTGFSGVPRPREWPPVIAVDAPGLTGEEVHFVVLADVTLVVDENLPDGSLEPLAREIEEALSPPYRAYGVRRSPTVWAVVAEEVAIVTLADVDENAAVVEVASLDGERTCTIDGRDERRSFPELDAVGAGVAPDYIVRAERIEPETWVVDAWAL